MLGLPLNLISCQQANVLEKTKNSEHNTLLYFLSYLNLLTGVNSHTSNGLHGLISENFILPFKPAGETKLWLVRLSHLCNSRAFFPRTMEGT